MKLTSHNFIQLPFDFWLKNAFGPNENGYTQILLHKTCSYFQSKVYSIGHKNGKTSYNNFMLVQSSNKVLQFLQQTAYPQPYFKAARKLIIFYGNNSCAMYTVAMPQQIFAIFYCRWQYILSKHCPIRKLVVGYVGT